MTELVCVEAMFGLHKRACLRLDTINAAGLVGKADMAFSQESAFAVAIESKADIGRCTADVRF
jgi:hypothetical protein